MIASRSSRDRALSLRGVLKAVLVGFLVAGVWLAGLFLFAGMIPKKVADTETRTDAIVVLTGGSERLSEGFSLLSEAMAEKLFVSGVYHGVEVEELLRLSRGTAGELECCVELGHRADDTTGNATETAGWINKHGYKSLRLVTASYHMPRSLLEFRRVLPGIAVVPHPVFPSNVKHEQWWAWPGTARLVISEYNKYVLARIRHWVTPIDTEEEKDATPR